MVSIELFANDVCPVLSENEKNAIVCINYPNTTSSNIINAKPTAKKMVLRLVC